MAYILPFSNGPVPNWLPSTTPPSGSFNPGFSARIVSNPWDSANNFSSGVYPPPAPLPYYPDPYLGGGGYTGSSRSQNVTRIQKQNFTEDYLDNFNNIWDANKDGKLETSEVVQPGWGWTEANWEKNVKKFDKDKDGKLNFKECLKMWSSYDKDKNGRLNATETIAYQNPTGCAPPAPTPPETPPAAPPATPPEAPPADTQARREAAKGFDAVYYMQNNPDVAAAYGATNYDEAYKHFLSSGKKEGRNPNANFDTQAYLNQNPDVAAAVQRGEITAFDHYLSSGFNEGRTPF